MGENKKNIFNVGSLSIIEKVKKINYEKKLKINLKNLILKKNLF